jgi:hypothetical protein
MCVDLKATEEVYCSLFKYLGKHPGPWWLSALRLKGAADALRVNCWPDKREQHSVDAATADFYVGPIYMLLMGMAIEAALKAVLVAKNSDLVGGQEISTAIGTHHLASLWNRAGVGRVPSAQCDSLLNCLEDFVVVFGRYPVSKKASGMSKAKHASFQGQLHFDQVTRLWGRLEEHAKKTMPELFGHIVDGLTS